MRHGLLAIAAAALALVLMVGMYGILDILPVFGFLALLIAYAALSHRSSSGRPRRAPTGGRRR